MAAWCILFGGPELGFSLYVGGPSTDSQLFLTLEWGRIWAAIIPFYRWGKQVSVLGTVLSAGLHELPRDWFEVTQEWVTERNLNPDPLHSSTVLYWFRELDREPIAPTGLKQSLDHSLPGPRPSPWSNLLPHHALPPLASPTGFILWLFLVGSRKEHWIGLLIGPCFGDTSLGIHVIKGGHFHPHILLRGRFLVVPGYGLQSC